MPSEAGARRLFSRLLNLLFPARSEREMQREMNAHLALLQDDFERRGLSSKEAAYAARREYGGVAQAQELHRRTRSFPWFDEAAQDLRYAARGIVKSPGFTLLAVIALGLGIGMNTSLFTAYTAVALKPLPVSDPDRVVRFERWVESRSSGNFQYGFSYPEYLYARGHARSFSSLAAASWVLPVSGGDLADRPLFGQLVSANYFDALGIRPLIGRGFLAEEDQSPGGNPVAVIAYEFWKNRLNGDVRALGQTIKLNAVAFTIAGVAPEQFTGTPETPTVVDFWAPLSMQAQLVPGQDWLHQPDQKHFQVFARLTPGANRRAAQSETDLLIRQFAHTYAENDRTTSVTLQRTSYFPNTDDIRFRALAAALMLIVGLVLLVACANVGNMVLARSAARQREFSTRLALGAGRGRLVRQLMTESLLLSFLGGIAGLLISIWTTALLGNSLQQLSLFIGGDSSVLRLSPDSHVLLYVAGISLAAGILFGLPPALRFSRRDMTEALKGEASASGRPGGSRLRGFLVGAQVAVSVLLLAIAGLLARGLVRSRAADPGFDARRVFVVSADFGNFGGDPVKATSRQARLVEQLRSRPEFAGLALGSQPFNGTWTPPLIAGKIRGRTLASYASETYFQTLGIPLLSGRCFTPDETKSGAPVVLISESTARTFFPNQNPLGQELTLDTNFRGNLESFEVIGVVKDIRYANLTRLDPAHVYLPSGRARKGTILDLLVSIAGEPQRGFRTIETAVEQSDRPLLPSLRLINLDQSAVQTERVKSGVFAIYAAVLAALALTLAGVGIYGVIAYLVSQRTREIGVRLAMGAPAAAIWRTVILSGLRPVLSGTGIGLAIAAALSTILHQTLVFPGSEDFLYGVPFYDPLTFATLVMFVLGVAALASSVPARRALRVDPASALRYE